MLIWLIDDAAARADLSATPPISTYYGRLVRSAAPNWCAPCWRSLPAGMKRHARSSWSSTGGAHRVPRLLSYLIPKRCSSTIASGKRN